MAAPTGYRRSEVFTLAWESYHNTHDGVRYWVLNLAKVHLQYRIYEVKNSYVTYSRYRDEKPLKLGIHPSLEEAKWMALFGILYFQLYVTGEWTPQDYTRKSQYIAARNMQPAAGN